MAGLKGDNAQLTLAPEEQAVIVRGGITVQFNGDGGVTVLRNGVTVYPLPAKLTQEFLASAKQGQVLPDGSVHIKLEDGSHWAVATNVATSREYGWGNNLGPVGKWMAEKNQYRVHGHEDWQMPNRAVGKALYDARNEGELKALFASVRGLWLAEHNDDLAIVQWFDDGHENFYHRYYNHSVCAVRRLDI